MVDLFELVLNSPYSNTLIRQYTLTAISKLFMRISETASGTGSAQRERIRTIITHYSDSQDLEIQQRAVEFDSLFSRTDLVGGVLEHMPVPELRTTIMGTSECFWVVLIRFGVRAITTRLITQHSL
jgi:AP-1 complex subunit gamma-1